MLLEVAFVQTPQFNVPSPCQAAQFFNSRDLYGVGLSHLRSGLPQPEAHLPEDPLALTHAQRHAIALAQVLGEQFAVPQMADETKCSGVASQVAPQRRPLFRVQCRRPAERSPSRTPSSPWLSNRLTQR